MRPLLRTLSLSLALAACVSPALADQLVTNGDFQTGNLSGWGYNPMPLPITNQPWTVLQNGANYYAGVYCQGPLCVEGNATQEDYLFQDLTTVAGQSYTLSFDYSAVGAAPDELAVYFGSDLVTDMKNTADGILTYTFTVEATSDITRLEFFGEQNNTYDYLDNVSVTTPTPEPGTIALVSTGILGLVGSARRRLFT